jgi:Zn finger protein HypA/HybF involved in hydrogenase expression
MIPDQDVVVSCTRCTVNVPINQTTYENNSRNLICFECYNKLAQGLHPDKVVQKAEPSDRLNYKCNNCGFKFSRGVNFQFSGACGNCGKHTLEIEETQQRVLVKDRNNKMDF